MSRVWHMPLGLPAEYLGIDSARQPSTWTTAMNDKPLTLDDIRYAHEELMAVPPPDPLYELAEHLHKHGKPPLPWVVQHGADTAKLWRESATPDGMVVVLQLAGHPMTQRARYAAEHARTLSWGFGAGHRPEFFEYASLFTEEQLSRGGRHLAGKLGAHFIRRIVPEPPTFDELTAAAAKLRQRR